MEGNNIYIQTYLNILMEGNNMYIRKYLNILMEGNNMYMRKYLNILINTDKLETIRIDDKKQNGFIYIKGYNGKEYNGEEYYYTIAKFENFNEANNALSDIFISLKTWGFINFYSN